MQDQEYDKAPISQIARILELALMDQAPTPGTPDDFLESASGLALPLSLRCFLISYGRRETFMNKYLRFTPANQLKVQDGFCIICRDYQFAPCWGGKATDLSLPDPPVYERRERLGTFHLHFTRLSRFLNSASCWQCMHMQPIQAYSEDVLAFLGRLDLEPALCVDGAPGGTEMTAHFGAGVIACSFPARNVTYFGLADTKTLTQLQDKLKRQLVRTL